MRGKSAGIVVASIVAVLGSTAGAQADTPTKRRASAPDVDVRATSRGSTAPTTAQRRAARGLDEARVTFDSATGLPSSATADDGAMTPKSAASAETVVRRFLTDNAELFGLSAAQRARLRVAGQDVTPNFTALTLQQTDAGRDVLGARMTFGLDNEGRIMRFDATYDPGASAGSDTELSAADAVRKAVRAVGESASTLPQKRRGTTAARKTTFENTVADGVSQPADLTAQLVTFPMPDGPARLAWKTVTEVDEVGYYESVVDARSGTLLARQNYYDHVAPDGNVFTVQHPGIGGAVQQEVSFAGATGFNTLGWLGTSRFSVGNAVDAYQDPANDNAAANSERADTPASPAAGFQRFNFPFTNAWSTSGGTNVAIDKNAVVTQMFYYVNKYHDYFYGLGFTEARRNFQEDNFGRGPGTAGDADRIRAEADDSANIPGVGCNANFATPADGSRPRMQMFVGRPSCGNNLTQRAMNGDTNFHEISHGLSNRLVSMGSLGSGSQTGGMGEGWGDFFAISYWNDPVYGDYNNGNTTTGIRTVNYDNNTLTYADHCVPGCQVHADGEIWATTLWDLRRALIAKYGYSADRPDTTTTPSPNPGNRRAEQLAVDAMILSGTNPTFISQRDAILTADQATTGGADKCLIWGVFAARRMGFGALVGGSQAVGTTSTTLPPECVSASAGGPYTTAEGTDVTLSAAGSTGSGLTYAWDLDNDGAFDDATGVAPTFQLVGDNGVRTVRVRVTDGGGTTATATSTVTVTNVAPVAGPTTVGTPRSTNTPIAFSGAITDAGWLDSLTATINYGDGSGTVALGGTVENARPNASLTYATTHTYTTAGTFTVTVCGTDDDGAGDCEPTMVTVIAQCADTLDNDTNGRADFPQDLGCASATDPLEASTVACPAIGQTGTGNGDFLAGTGGADLIRGAGGNDHISGFGGVDCLFGDGGEDRMKGGGGNDLLDGGADDDTLEGEAGADVIYGGAGVETVLGGTGNDLINLEAGADTVLGGSGNDRIVSRDGSVDTVDCDVGNDTAIVDAMDLVTRCEIVIP